MGSGKFLTAKPSVGLVQDDPVQLLDQLRILFRFTSESLAAPSEGNVEVDKNGLVGRGGHFHCFLVTSGITAASSRNSKPLEHVFHAASLVLS